MNTLEVSRLCTHRGQTQILHDVTFSLPTGSIVALFGPNGAGKTTLFKTLLSLVHMSSGAISISGIAHTQPNSRIHISYLPEKFSFFDYFTVKQAIECLSSFYAKTNSSMTTSLILKTAHIQHLEQKKIGTLSKGETQKVGLAQTFINQDAVLYLLDEPFSGIDPIDIYYFKERLKLLKQAGKTVFLSTHVIGEVEDIIDEYLILHKGKVLEHGKRETLGARKTMEQHFMELINAANL